MTPSRLLLLACLGLTSIFIVSCGGGYDDRHAMIVSVRDQRMLLVKDDKPVKSYPISTSKFGLGSRSGSRHTPLGKHEVVKKIGDGAAIGTVFKGRRRTGEVIRPNSPGRDPIVTRILWLRGLERHNRNTMARCVYIHGTPAEHKIGRPASYGCIRMKSHDVIDLYKRVGEGADVRIIRGSLDATRPGARYYAATNNRYKNTATRWY